MARIIESLKIESLAYGGHGLGHHEGKVIFVPFTAPGDLIRCRIGREKKRYAEGVVDKILSLSQLRRHAPCPVFGECGGCQWQHLPYSEQARSKESIFRSILEKQARVDSNLIRPLAAAPQEWGYRSRAQLKIHQTDRGLVMGFYRRGTHLVADTESCPILHPRLNEAWALFRCWLNGIPDSQYIPQLDLETGDDGGIRAVVHYLGDQSGRLKEHLAPRAEKADISLLLQCGRKDNLTLVTGREELIIHVDDPSLSLQYGAGGFAQVNLPQNRALVNEVVALLPPDCGWLVLDLYCGMGNFSLPLARRAGRVIGVENFAPAIVRARQNAIDNGLNNAEFHALPAHEAVSRFSTEEGFDMVLLDPPRSGAWEVIKELVRLLPQRILYISCDPPTLARDLVPLLHGGYRVEWARAFDLFPQTHHTESITLLSRAGG